MSDRDVDKTIEALLEERRTFAPPEAFTEAANAGDPSISAWSMQCLLYCSRWSIQPFLINLITQRGSRSMQKQIPPRYWQLKYRRSGFEHSHRLLPPSN